MATGKWQAEQNQHDNCTKKSRKRMNTIGTYLKAQLDTRKLEEGIGPLLLFYSPLFESFRNMYISWLAAQGSYRGATQAFEALLAELSGDAIADWDVAILNVHKKKTDRYKALFPNLHGPFQKGNYESRTAAIRTLIAAIGDEAALRDVKGLIETFLSRFETARNLRQGLDGLVKSLSLNVEVERVKCADGMFYVQGALMKQFYNNRAQIGTFFDLENMRKSSAEEEIPEGGLVLTLAPLQTLEAGITFTADAVFLFINHGEGPLTIWVGGETPGEPLTPFVLAAGEEAEKPVSELGEAGSRFLYIQNNNPDLPGSVEIITIEE